MSEQSTSTPVPNQATNLTPNLPGVPEPEDVMNLSSDKKVSYILDVRRRIQADSSYVSDDEIRNAVRLIRTTRSDAGRAKKATKTPKPTVTLADF